MSEALRLAALLVALGLAASCRYPSQPAGDRRASAASPPLEAADHCSPDASTPGGDPAGDAATAGPLSMFPQVSEDGKLVAVAVADSGGARAEGSVSIQIVDVATDRVAKAFVLSDGGPSDAADPRQWAAALAFLASGHWRKLHHFEIVDDPGAPQHPTWTSTATVQLARSDKLVVLYHEPRLQIAAVEDGGQHPLREAMVPKWSAKPPGPQCPKPWASLTDAYGDLELRVAVLFIEYHGGSDVCWEPETTVHAIRWPAMR